ncbi:hypothetical protein AMS68_004759 [Peltaster fructicola]|uniref:Uncharacterized protein n=1 Tax=Peltaster fructicola TaxID=286661 RepID=A0A6H0XWU1_9PEZI|nr:hypothetical protein AMS68_004759 [Peltaster fructicola]
MGVKLAFGLVLLSTIATTHARLHRHAAIEVKRQAVPAVAATTTQQALTTIYPSPDASPVVVTEQSQLVPSFVPQFTLCELPPLAFFPQTLAPTTSIGSLPYLNYSISTPSGSGSCTTIYKPTVTMVCATTLSDLTTTYTISQCAQDVTFSTQYGYELVIPTPTPAPVTGSVTPSSLSLITPPPSVQTVTTYYLAPWQDLTSAGPPADVDYKICTGYANGTEQCVLEYYKWKTSLLTLTATTTTLINITTTIPGPSQLLVETFVANVTGTATTLSMSTTMELETSTLSETTIVSTKPTQSTGSTVFQTQTLQYAP